VPYGLYRASVPVQGCALPFLLTALEFTKESRKYKQLAVKFMNVVVIWPYTEIGLVYIF